MNFELVTISPDKARIYLEKNIDNNRHISQNKVELYRRDMVQDLWRINGETIKINKSGRLVDGQHRLTAIVQSNKTVKMWVCSGVPDDSFDTIDTGKPRGAADILAIAGIADPVNTSAIVRCFLLLEHFEGKYAGQKSIFSPAIVLERYRKEPDFFDTINKEASKHYDSFSKLIPKSVIGGLQAYIKQYSIHQDRLSDFRNQMYENINPCRTINSVRKKLMDDKTSNQAKKLSLIMKVNAVIKGWNHFAQNKFDVQKIQLDTVDPII